MRDTPQEMKLIGELGLKIEKLCEEAIGFQLDHRTIALLLLQTSEKIAKDGGPLITFDHALWMEEEGKRMLHEFEKLYADVLDWDELIQGKEVYLHTEAVQ